MLLVNAQKVIEEKGEELANAVEKEGIETFFTTGEDAIKKHLHISDSDITQLVNESCDYCRRNEWDQALKCLECLVFFEPTNPHHLLRMGAVLMQLGNIQEATQVLATASCVNPENPIPYLYLGNCFLELQKKHEAREMFQECANLSKNQSEYAEVFVLANEGVAQTGNF